MTLFPPSDLKEAFLCAERGGQALLMRRRPTKNDRGWLIDHDAYRLIATGRRLGLRWPFPIHRYNSPGQYINLGGRPLGRAISECQAMELPLEGV